MILAVKKLGRWRGFRSVAILLFLLVVVSGCAAKENPLELEERLVWPPPPLEEKIEWVAEYKIIGGQHQDGGLWQSVKNFIFGTQQTAMTRPYGICTDGKTKLFIADTGAAVIHVYDMETLEYQVIKGTRQNPVVSPIGVTYLSGAIYFTDSVQAKIFKYDLNTKKLSLWAYVGLERPTGIAVSREGGYFFVVDTLAQQVVSYDRHGAELLRFGARGTGAGQFNFPTDIAIGPEEQIYITDSLNARVQVFSQNGRYLSSFGQAGDTPGSFSKPKGIGVDLKGHIFICDALFDAVQIFDPDGQLLLTFGDNGTGRGQFWMPSGLYVDTKGNVFVADTYNRRIQQFRALHR